MTLNTVRSGPSSAYWLGRVTYDEAHALQLALRDERITDPKLPPSVLLLDHQPVITFGRRRLAEDLRVSTAEIKARGVEIRHAERGGRVTYHGPGQLVVYVIGALRSLAPDLPTYVWSLEESMIRALAEFGIAAARCPTGRGVWIGDAKIGAVGVAVTRGVCWHGFAFNIDPDLSHFALIRPCGLDIPVTSIARLISPPPSLHTVAVGALASLSDILRLDADLTER